MSDPWENDADAKSRRIPGDIEVDGVLRIADDTICEGDLRAPAGVVLGARVFVEGDVYTDGPVELGPGARIEGEVIPAADSQDVPMSNMGLDAEPETAGGKTQAQMAAPADARTRVESAALTSTLDVLLTLALKEDASETGAMGMETDALEDLLEGAYQLIADIHREGDTARPWDETEVASILVQKVLPHVLPISLEGRDQRTLRVRISRPAPDTLEGPAPRDWPDRVLGFVDHLLATVRKDARTELVSPTGTASTPTGPDTIAALIRLDGA